MTLQVFGGLHRCFLYKLFVMNEAENIILPLFCLSLSPINYSLLLGNVISAFISYHMVQVQAVPTCSVCITTSGQGEDIEVVLWLFGKGRNLWVWWMCLYVREGVCFHSRKLGDVLLSKQEAQSCHHFTFKAGSIVIPSCLTFKAGSTGT